MEIINSFGDHAFRPEYDPWDSVDFRGSEHNIQEEHTKLLVLPVMLRVAPSIVFFGVPIN